MKFISRVVVAGICALATGCGGDSPEPAGGDQKKDKTYSDESIAFMFGKRYSEACMWATLENAAKTAESIGDASALARALGVAEPATPDKENGIAMMDGSRLAPAIKAKKGEKVATVFLLSAHLNVGAFGAMIKADTVGVIDKIERLAKASGVPEDVWKGGVARIRAAPTDHEGYTSLGEALKAHFDA